MAVEHRVCALESQHNAYIATISPQKRVTPVQQHMPCLFVTFVLQLHTRILLVIFEHERLLAVFVSRLSEANADKLAGYDVDVADLIVRVRMYVCMYVCAYNGMYVCMYDRIVNVCCV